MLRIRPALTQKTENHLECTCAREIRGNAGGVALQARCCGAAHWHGGQRRPLHRHRQVRGWLLQQEKGAVFSFYVHVIYCCTSLKFFITVDIGRILLRLEISGAQLKLFISVIVGNTPYVSCVKFHLEDSSRDTSGGGSMRSVGFLGVFLLVSAVCVSADQRTGSAKHGTGSLIGEVPRPSLSPSPSPQVCPLRLPSVCSPMEFD